MIHIHVPGVPPTVNHAYGTNRQGMRFLKPEGKKYKTETKTYIARTFSQELKFFEPNRPYTLITVITFDSRDDLYCATYPERAKNRFQQLDVSNRVKLFEDAFAEATGIDDSCTFTYSISKRWSNLGAEMNLWAWSTEKEQSPFDELLRNLLTTCA